MKTKRYRIGLSVTAAVIFAMGFGVGLFFKIITGGIEPSLILIIWPLILLPIIIIIAASIVTERTFLKGAGKVGRIVYSVVFTTAFVFGMITGGDRGAIIKTIGMALTDPYFYIYIFTIFVFNIFGMSGARLSENISKSYKIYKQKQAIYRGRTSDDQEPGDGD